MAIASDAAVIMKELSCSTPFFVSPLPTVIALRALSFMSNTLDQRILLLSMSSLFPWKMWSSSIAASRLLAAPTASMSPVNPRLMSCIGSTVQLPPPAAPPLTPNIGPSEGCLRLTMAFLPSLLRPIAVAMAVTVFPSP